MIREFSATNFMSIKEKQTISFEATKDHTSEELLTVQIAPNIRLLKMVLLYGANASGKTNLLMAIENLWWMLFRPNTNKDNKIGFYPFALSPDQPTVYEITFYVNQDRYHYILSYNESNVLYELMEYAPLPHGVMSLFYERTYTNANTPPIIKFGNKLKLKAKQTFEDNTLNNHTVLSTFGKVSVDAQPIQILYDWIQTKIHEIDKRDQGSIIDVIKNIIQDNSKKDFFLKAICKADFNITNFNIIEIENNIPEELRKQIQADPSLPEKIKKQLLKEKREDVEFIHHTHSGDFPLSVKRESRGTVRYLRLLGQLYDMVKENHIYLIDEIESGLHYDLLIHYLSVFMMNSECSQLIITTHDQSLLDEDFIRRDMVWFTEKSEKTGATEVYSAADFGLHKNVSLYNAYRIGKLGAKPEIGSPFIEINQKENNEEA